MARKTTASRPLPPTASDLSKDTVERSRPGLMVETNGGSSIEKVPGFNNLRPMTAGFATKIVSGPTILASTPDGGFFSILPGALEPAITVPAPVPGTPTYGAAGKPEDVIGIDDRVMVKDTAVSPWRQICHLEITYDSGQVGFGTGWFAGPKTVITAAHCLYVRGREPHKAERVRIIPGRNGTLAPYGYIIAKDIRPNDKWKSAATDQEAAPFDYGAIIIEDAGKTDVDHAPFGERIGYFGMRCYSDEEEQQLDMAIVNNAGYPHEAGKPYGSLWFNAGRVHMHNGVAADKHFLEYMADTTPGQSGSPVFLLDTKTNQRFVVAIHTTGNFVNRGVRLTAEVYDTILEWLK